jgi:hypothetical protein
MPTIGNVEEVASLSRPAGFFVSAFGAGAAARVDFLTAGFFFCLVMARTPDSRNSALHATLINVLIRAAY